MASGCTSAGNDSSSTCRLSVSKRYEGQYCRDFVDGRVIGASRPPRLQRGKGGRGSRDENTCRRMGRGRDQGKCRCASVGKDSRYCVVDRAWFSESTSSGEEDSDESFCLSERDWRSDRISDRKSTRLNSSHVSISYA